MTHFEIVAHRGAREEAPENTLPAFQRAIELGADAIELDVRLTADRVPVVYHYFYLDEIASLSGPIFDYTYDQLKEAAILSGGEQRGQRFTIPTLEQVLEAVGDQIGLEIEIKGPEPEAAEIIQGALRRFRPLWERMEVTSYEPLLLLGIREGCPGLATDLLIPRSEAWMKLDVVAYLAAHRARLARARAVHLHPTQFAPEVVAAIRQHGIQVHAWDVNDEPALRAAVELNIPRICTDRLRLALSFRQALST